MKDQTHFFVLVPIHGTTATLVGVETHNVVPYFIDPEPFVMYV